ncbi:MAG: hypothetical protein ACYCWW_11215 [Deltaproteobacteria bacterium]
MRKWTILTAMALAASCTSAQTTRDETGTALREETENHRTVTGRVAAVDKYRNLVFVDADHGGTIQLRLSRHTIVSSGGAPAALTDIREGAPIRAAFRPHLGQNIALVVDVTPTGIPRGDRSREGTGPNNVRAPGAQPVAPDHEGAPATAP